VAVRALLIVCLLGSAWAVCATAAEADEIFVLKNGVVLRGYAMRETDDSVVVRLTGMAEDNRITVRRDEIVRRYTTSRLVAKTTDPKDLRTDPVPKSAPLPAGSNPNAPYLSLPPATTPLPNEEPESEVFFIRFAKVAQNAVPDNLKGQVIMAALLMGVLMLLVGVGARLVDLDPPSWMNLALLSLLLGGIAIGDLMYPHIFLRTDRAIWVLPAQLIGWCGASRMVMGGPISRSVLLMGFSLFALTSFLFVTGAVLVSF